MCPIEKGSASLGGETSKVEGVGAQEIEKQSELKDIVALEIPEVVDLDFVSLKLGEKVGNFEIRSFSHKTNGSLEKYLIRYQTDDKNYYLTRNTNYQTETAFNNLRIVHEALPENVTPQPVSYLPELDAMFYEELRGDAFLSRLEKMDEGERQIYFRKVGEALRRLHQVDPQKIDKTSSRDSASLENIMGSINGDTFIEIERANSAFYARLKKLYDVIVSFENNLLGKTKLVISHGDFHPANLIINEEGQVGLVDFSDVTVAPRARDLGSFLEQINTMMRFRKLADEERTKNYQKSFLEGYGGDVKIDDAEIIFYRAWIAWRNAMYNAAKPRFDYKEAEIALASTEKYLRDLKII